MIACLKTTLNYLYDITPNVNQAGIPIYESIVYDRYGNDKFYVDYNSDLNFYTRFARNAV